MKRKDRFERSNIIKNYSSLFLWYSPTFHQRYIFLKTGRWFLLFFNNKERHLTQKFCTKMLIVIKESYLYGFLFDLWFSRGISSEVFPLESSSCPMNQFTYWPTFPVICLLRWQVSAFISAPGWADQDVTWSLTRCFARSRPGATSTCSATWNTSGASETIWFRPRSSTVSSTMP